MKQVITTHFSILKLSVLVARAHNIRIRNRLVKKSPCQSEYPFSTGINLLAFRQSGVYTRLCPIEHNLFSERVIGSEPPFQKASKPVVATDETGFFKHHFLRSLSCDQLPIRHNRRLYPARIVRAAIRCTIAPNVLCTNTGQLSEIRF